MSFDEDGWDTANTYASGRFVSLLKKPNGYSQKQWDMIQQMREFDSSWAPNEVERRFRLWSKGWLPEISRDMLLDKIKSYLLLENTLDREECLCVLNSAISNIKTNTVENEERQSISAELQGLVTDSCMLDKERTLDLLERAKSDISLWDRDLAIRERLTLLKIMRTAEKEFKKSQKINR